MIIKNSISFLTVLFTILFCGCNESYICLKENPYKAEGGHLAINIDSSATSFKGCIYYVKTLINLPSGRYSDKAILFFTNGVFYMRLLDPLSEDFVLFDMKDNKYNSRTIEIKHSGIVDKLDCVFQDKLITSENLEVRIFRIKNFMCYNGLCLDAIFFVTKDYGIVGSYFTDSNYQEKIMISPSGNIFKDYIDYSAYSIKEIL